MRLDALVPGISPRGAICADLGKVEPNGRRDRLRLDSRVGGDLVRDFDVVGQWNDVRGQAIVEDVFRFERDLQQLAADFKLRTRNRRLDDPTQLADRIFRTGLSLLEKETDGTKFRLIGIGVSDLQDPTLADPPDLVDAQAARRAAAEAAMDKLRDKFGKGTVQTGYTFPTKR